MNGDLSSAADFGDNGMESQPDDMNIQAQSLIAALSALVPQSQGLTDQGSRLQGQGSAEAPITIDLTDDEEPTLQPKTTDPVLADKDRTAFSPPSGSKAALRSSDALPADKPSTPEA